MPRSGGTGQGCALVAAQMFVLFLLGLAVDAQTGDRTGLETGDGDLFAAFVANTVGAVVDALQRGLDLADQAHRLGFAPEDMPRLIERLKSQNAVIARSVFSHLVGSDASQFDAFTRGQIEMFEAASMQLQAAFPHKILRHICNSAGIERFPGAQFDMVRLGIGLYGISPIDNTIINNVSTLKTTILQIREVPEEDTVGYSRKGHLKRDSRIAALPIGYADGLNRHLGNGHAYCLVNGQRAPYVGNICMDVCMIDVTDIECKEGDIVEIFGDHLPITVLSDVLETIPYEVLTSVSTRVKRVYYQD